MPTQSATGLNRELAESPVDSLTILCHPDPDRVGERVVLTALLSGKAVELSRMEPRFAPLRGGVGRALEDLRLSRTPMRLSPTPAGGLLLDATATRTPLRIDDEEAAAPRELSPEELIRGVVLLLAHRVVLLLRRTEQTVPISLAGGLIGDSAAMMRVRREIRRVADLDCPVLVRGESGTGKELVARAIHDAGPRRQGPYVEVNVGAIPRELAPAELFGRTKGAYTGADRWRRGYFQRAAGGTLLLDEIGEASPEVQVALLRALDTKQIQPVGAEEPQKIDVRVIAATDVDLKAASRSQAFRPQLFHRLSAYEIHLPPLCERREDFGLLFFHFLRRELTAIDQAERLRPPGSDEHPWVPAELISRLVLYPWPGNVRELHNVVRQLVVASRGRPQMELVPRVEELLAEAPAATVKEAATPPEEGASEATPERRYRRSATVADEELLDALREEHWNVSRAAPRLGVSRTALYRLIDACPRIRKASDLAREQVAAALQRCAGDVESTAELLQVSPRGLRLHMRELGLG